MSDEYHTHIAKLETFLAGVDRKLEEFEQIERDAGGHVSQSFAHKLEDLRRQRALLTEKLEELKLEDAESWEKKDFEAGLLRVWDEIGDRVARIVGSLRRH